MIQDGHFGMYYHKLSLGLWIPNVKRSHQMDVTFVIPSGRYNPDYIPAIGPGS